LAPKGSDFSLFLRAYWQKSEAIEGSRTPPAALTNFAMSAYGSLQTLVRTLSMSALRGTADISDVRSSVRFGSLADITARSRHVRFTPIADIRQCRGDVREVPLADIAVLRGTARKPLYR
jgi:hypothetical protein